MGGPIITLPLRSQEDVLLTRRRARDLAGFLQLGAEAQSRLATAVWEVARLAYRHGAQAEVELAVAEEPAAAAVVTIRGIAHAALTGEATVNELRMQNAELVTALATLRDRERELTALNRELADTNRGITALLAELGQQAEELRERAAGSSRFLSALTHELRTPLYAVRGMAEAILREGGDALHPRLREDVRLIDGAMEEALDLVNDHLDLARLAAGRQIVRISDVQVDELFSALRGI